MSKKIMFISLITMLILALTLAGCGSKSSKKSTPAQVSKPVFAPGSGAYSEAQTVTITCATAGAAIRYTNDGSTPSATNGILYEGSIAVNNTQTLQAIAYKAGMANSPVVTAVYEIAGTVANPVFDPVGGTYNKAQTVEITCATPGASIYYTTDGSDPTESSTLYSASIPVSDNTTIKAIAYKDGWTSSSVVTAEYTLKVSDPTFSPAAGTYDAPQTVTISCATAGAKIRYTTDGSTPTESSTLYSAPIPVDATTTIKAIAYKDGWTSSSVVTAEYTIKTAPIIKIGGETVRLGLDSLDAYPGLSWDADQEQLVLNGYNGAYIHQDYSSAVKSIRLWVAGDSTIDGGNLEALFFIDGIAIEGGADATLILKSTRNRALFGGFSHNSQVKDLTLAIDLNHTYTPDNNFTTAIHAGITVSGTGRLQITAIKDNNGVNLVSGIQRNLTLEDTASATITVIGETDLTTNAYGIYDGLFLNGSGACEITVTNNGTGTTQALYSAPTVPAGYSTTGAWDSGYVKYYIPE